MASEEKNQTEWKQIASFNVLDGRQYESNHASDYSKSVHYEIKSIGNYIGGDNSEFLSIPKDNQLPKLVPNIRSLINEDLNNGYTWKEHLICKTKSFTDVLSNHFPSFNAKQAGIQFITFRNNLNKIMAAPYYHSKSEYDAFAIDIVRKDGIIFLGDCG